MLNLSLLKRSLRDTIRGILFFLIVALFSYFVFQLSRATEDQDKLLVENKAMFITHCIKVDKQPWYICENTWDGFSTRFKINFKVEAAKYM